MIYWLELVRLSEGHVFKARLGSGPLEKGGHITLAAGGFIID